MLALPPEPTERNPRSHLRRGLARLSAGLSNLPLRRHFVALGALSLLHITVFIRSLHGVKGVPALAIPYDFFNSYARFLMYISDRVKWESHTLVGAGILGMAIIFLLSWVWTKFFGVKYE